MGVMIMFDFVIEWESQTSHSGDLVPLVIQFLKYSYPIFLQKF